MSSKAPLSLLLQRTGVSDRGQGAPFLPACRSMTPAWGPQGRGNGTEEPVRAARLLGPGLGGPAPPAGSRPEAHLPGSPCASAASVGPTLTLGAAGGSEPAALFLLEQGAEARTW